jgi:hypothetical protein
VERGVFGGAGARGARVAAAPCRLPPPDFLVLYLDISDRSEFAPIASPLLSVERAW